MIHYQNIPQELKERPQWVCWKYVTRDEKQTKVPISALTGREAKTNKPTTWSTFDQAVGHYRCNADLAGIGFVFTQDDPFVGIDIDDCIGSCGQLTSEGQDAVQRFGSSYYEVSPSRTGLKFWIRGRLPTPSTGRKNPALGVEAYHYRRFFTVTGLICSQSPNPVVDCNAALQEWFASKFPGNASPDKQAYDVIECPRSAGEIIAEDIRSNPRLAKLFDGDFQDDFPSQSEADLSFCTLLANLTGPDPDMIDEVFRSSQLYREKWERSAYRHGTINKAILSGLRRRHDPTLAFAHLLDIVPVSTTFVGSTPMTIPISNSVISVSMSDIEWPAPIPLLGPRPDAMVSSDFPPSIEPMISAVVAQTETPWELPGLIALGVLATASQKKYAVMLPDGHTEQLAIWVCPAMDPGNRKTAVVHSLTAALKTWESKQRFELAPIVQENTEKRIAIEKRSEVLRNNAAKASDPQEQIAFQNELNQLNREVPKELYFPTLFTADCTPEQLASLMFRHDERIAIISDEGGIFAMMQGRYSRGIPNLDVYLQGHAGSSVRVHRGSKEPIELNSPCLTIAISPQPYLLQQIAATGEFTGRGLLDRFFFAVPESKLGFRTLESCPIDEHVKTSWQKLVHSILDQPFLTDEDGGLISKHVSLSTSAFQLWKHEQKENEQDMRPGNTWSTKTGWAGKYPGAVLRLAGILHVAELASYGLPPEKCHITEETMAMAIKLGRKLKSSTAFAFGFMRSEEKDSLAEKISQWICRSHIPDFTIRDAYRCCNGGRTSEAFRDAITILEEHYWIKRAEEDKRPGRPSEMYLVNPKVYATIVPDR
jgi:hypothetical protein